MADCVVHAIRDHLAVLRVTLDTNAVNPTELCRIEAACEGRDVEVVHTTVTDREQEGTEISGSPATLMETAVWGESRWDRSVWGGAPIPESLVPGESRGDDAPPLLEAILRVINGERLFPPPGGRDNLTRKQRGRFRDAMILEAHAREHRDVFITNDKKDFYRDGRREQLEALCSTRIYTVDEFVEHLSIGDERASRA